MSFRYAHAGVYRCDEPGCTEKLLAPDGELPKGWSEWTREIVSPTGAPSADDVMRHRCPAHSTEAKP